MLRISIKSHKPRIYNPRLYAVIFKKINRESKNKNKTNRKSIDTDSEDYF